ncbi:Fic family protein [Streptomyces sp. KL116D]|uniref:Fic family protein n=1 Tax=Streptomyces sp. KL116D TaxID=3045152 RepID=UPI003559156E
MRSDLWPRLLTWDEVDPARHPFDAERAARDVPLLGPARCVPRRPELHAADPAMSAWSHGEGRLWADAMTYALIERYGRWAAGWRWAHDEGDFDGGPVGSWCCPRDSITTPEETLDRVVAALCEWRDWLEGLAAPFDAYPLDPAAVDDQRILWERAARRLIERVADRTGCGSGWHAHCRQVLSWFLSRWGVDPDVARELVESAVGGRFHSWTEPDTVVIDDVSERLALLLPADDRPRPSSDRPADHLEEWLAVRGGVAWAEVPADPDEGQPVTAVCDGAAEDIRAFDAALDPARAQGLLTALDLLRADAARGTRLDFELLRSWQRHVLDAPGPPAFRTLPAFAKDGRERYGIAADTRERLDACLHESAKNHGAPLALAARAARAYLDVCFFHPFDDGNARSAFLALVYVLAREGVTLDSVSLLRRISFQAGSAQDALSLTRYVGLHIAGARRPEAS